MLTFSEYLFMEASFGKGGDTLVAKAIIEKLGGDPSGTINLTDLVGDEEFKSAQVLADALEGAIEVARERGARKNSIQKAERALRQNRNNQMGLVLYISNIVNAAVADIEKRQERMDQDDWEKKPKKPKRRPDKGPEDKEEEEE